jgi:hypothetical protein
MAGHDAAAVGGLHALNGLIVLLFSHLLTRGPREREEPESYEEPLPAE